MSVNTVLSSVSIKRLLSTHTQTEYLTLDEKHYRLKSRRITAIKVVFEVLLLTMIMSTDWNRVCLNKAHFVFSDCRAPIFPAWLWINTGWYQCLVTEREIIPPFDMSLFSMFVVRQSDNPGCKSIQDLGICTDVLYTGRLDNGVV